MASRVLLVEGVDDKHVVWALFEHHNVEEVFSVEDAEGIDPLLESVPVRLCTASDLERLAVIIDADEDMDRRWDSLRSVLINAGYPELPDQPVENGTVVTLHDGKVFGVWVMPNNRLPGMLESFIAFLVPPDDALIAHVDAFVDGIELQPSRFPVARKQKARIHAWLAIQREPGKPLGQAVTARYLDADAAIVGSFIQWVRNALVV